MSDVNPVLANLIALFACLFTGLSVLYAARAIGETQRQSLAERNQASNHHRETAERDNEIQIAANYLALETNSSAIFQYTADIDEKIAHARGEAEGLDWDARDTAVATAILINLYYQSLNLFEVCSRFRRFGMIKHEVFASWIAWFIEILDDRYFRERWRDTIRSNYTRDVRDIFDVGVEIFSALPPGRERHQAFYNAVAEIMSDRQGKPCKVISDWLADIGEEKTWESLPSYQTFRSPGATIATSRAMPPALPAA